MSLIDDILDFSKIEACRLELVKEEFMLDSVVDSVVDLLAHRAQAKGLDFSVVVDPSVPSVFTGDPVRFRQVLMNLVGNGIKFTDEGEVLVEIMPTGTPAERELLVSVRDTGIGISQEQQEWLFKPFTQADASTTRRYGGTGLGLVISKRLVELMDGRIGLDSMPDLGSRFWFTLPLAATAPQEAPDWHEAASALHILVAEESESCRRSFEAALAGLVKPVFASTEDALVRELCLATRRYDVAFIDRRLFGSTAVDSLYELAQRRGALPRIILTGTMTESARVHAETLGLGAVLAKPIKRTPLQEMLR
ncbi:MAG: ATP-binding protein, partial [Roseimicrobium sp.]